MARLLRMPAVAANAEEAVLAEWPLPENERFAASAAIATVETEKAVVDVPADADGVLLRTLVAPGTTVRVGDPIALLGDPDETVADVDALLAELGASPTPSPAPSSASSTPSTPPAPSATSATSAAPSAGLGVAEGGAVVAPGALSEPGVAGPSASGDSGIGGGAGDGGGAGAMGEGGGPAVPGAASSPSSPSSGRVPARPAGREGEVGIDGRPASAVVAENRERIFASPIARRLAREAGLGLAELTGTGPGGRIVRDDVKRAVAARPAPAPTPAPATASAAEFEEIPHSRMRRAIATRLAESAREAPHFFVRGTARVDKLLKLRSELAASTKLSVTDLVVMAVARAHRAVPEMNVVWTDDAVRSFAAVDVGVAVATDRGLVTPVLRGADRLTAGQVAEATADLVARARRGRLRQEELEGGTITVSNLGGYGTEEFSAIINPPQAAILAVGAARREPVVHKGRLRAATVMRVTLSVDHRPVDGVVAARWMAAFLELIEHPVRILA